MAKEQLVMNPGTYSTSTNKKLIRCRINQQPLLRDNDVNPYTIQRQQQWRKGKAYPATLLSESPKSSSPIVFIPSSPSPLLLAKIPRVSRLSNKPPTPIQQGDACCLHRPHEDGGEEIDALLKLATASFSFG